MNRAEDKCCLTARSVYKSYWMKPHRLNIINGADLSVDAGDRVAVVGMSGAGKSTLLHILGALDTPDAGSVIIDGQDTGTLSKAAKAQLRARKIGFVFQSYNLLPEMNIVENVMLPAMALSSVNCVMEPFRRRAVELLEKAGMGHRLGHRPLELSGGEQQRVAIARALMNRPMIVLADEPTGNLDEKTGARVLEMLFSFAGEAGSSLVIVTHNERIADACSRKLRLVQGRIEQA